MDDFATSDATKALVGRRLEVLTGPERRRHYGDEEKGDALHSMEVALAMERLNLQV